jgi:hypothetical protein
MTAMMGEYKVQQHRDQNHILALQVELGKVSKKTDNTATEVSKCRQAISTMETKLSTISSAEENTKRFDKIEAMISVMSEPLQRISYNSKAMLTGKRKGQEITEGGHNNGEEEVFLDTSADMEAEEQQPLAITDSHTGPSDHTNSSQVISIYESRLK